VAAFELADRSENPFVLIAETGLLGLGAVTAS
jgi:hypothetical protein